MQDFRYALIRFIPDRQRMEPINVGVILQGAGRIDFRLSPHAARRKDIDTKVFRLWRQFLTDEIKGAPAPLFQPERTSAQFFEHLAQLCDETVSVTAPLLISPQEETAFDTLLEDFYRRLVAPPETTSPAAARRPTGRFRQIMEERDFLKRGMRRHSDLVVEGEPLWRPYRQVQNGHPLAIDKVEVNTQIGATANELDRLHWVSQKLPVLLDRGHGEFFLLADELREPFTDQSRDEFLRMQEDLESLVEQIRNTGGKVLRSVPQAEELAVRLDRELTPVPAVSAE